MKQRFCLTLLLAISTLFFGCGKVEPPTEETQTVKAKPKSGFTIDNEVKINHNGNVTVVDADTGLSIDNARVRSRFNSSTAGPLLNLAEDLGEGSFFLMTNGLHKPFFVGALADGYLPKDIMNPIFPLEIRLTRGETVNVTGEIVDADGIPVTQGVINLSVVNCSGTRKYFYGSDIGMYWPEFYPCSVYVDKKGKFTMSNVPANYKDVYARYECAGDSTVEFRNQIFDIENEDIHLKLQFPYKLKIQGQVIYSDGTAVSGAWVWVEKVADQELDVFNKFRTFGYEALDQVRVCTQADGKFEFKVNKVVDRYMIKACHPLYLPAFDGPYSDNKPAPEFVELIIKMEGQRLVGRIFDENDQPVTKCSASYFITKNIGKDGYSGTDASLSLEIDETGDYISGIVPPGVSQFTFQAPQYHSESLDVIMLENETTLLDIELSSFASLTMTGTVYDAESQQPLEGVTVKLNNGKIETTDSNGQFLASGSSIKIDFSTPGYAPSSAYAHLKPAHKYDDVLAANKALNPKFYMSPSASVRICVNDKNGQPLNSSKICIADNKNQTIKFENGEVLFTNLISHTSPLRFMIINSKGRVLLKLKNVELKAREEVVVCTNLPPSGNISLEFKNKIKTDGLHISLRKSSQEEVEWGKFHWYGGNSGWGLEYFKTEGQTLKLNQIPTNQYLLTIGSIQNRNAFLETNVFVFADETTTIMVDNNHDDLGVIKGTVKTIGAKSLLYNISVYNQKDNHRADAVWNSHDNSFKIENLPIKNLYTLKFSTKINSTNIVVKNLKPDGPSIDIVLPNTFTITGNIVDESGKSLKANVVIGGVTQSVKGEFKLYPVFPGKYKIVIFSYIDAKQSREVIVGNSDLDLGDIVL